MAPARPAAERSPVEDPATGETLVEVADASADDGLEALRIAADEPGRTGPRTAPRERGEILRRAFELMVERTDDLALLMTLEMGKPLAESRGEVAYAAEFLRWFSRGGGAHPRPLRAARAGDSRVLTMRSSRSGPCLFITPWNFPLAMGTRKIGPAIAAGCTMVVKPAKQTPLSMLALGADPRGGRPAAGRAERAHDASARARSSEPLLERPARCASCRSPARPRSAATLVEHAADQLLRISMELGGNAPFLVFDDADLDMAVDGAMLAKMRNMGEACTAANRFHVHESVAEEFSRRPGRADGRAARRPRHRRRRRRSAR